MRILPYRTSENVIAGVTMTFTNITQQKHEREQIPRLLQVAEKSAGMIMMTDMDGTIEYVNPHLLSITGYTESEVVGQTPRLFKASQQALEQYEQAWQQVLEGQEWQGEFQHHRKDGTTCWVSASFSPVRNSSGAITNVVIAEEDISFRKHAAAQRQRMNRLLAALGTWHRQSATTADTQAIAAAMCRLLVEVGSYRGAWVALLAAGAPEHVVSTVQAGFEAGYLERLDPLWCAHTQAQSPLHAPLHTGMPSIIAPLHDAEVPPMLSTDAQQHHYQQVAALAIRTETSTCGVLVVAASDPQAIQAVEVETLQILADNLAHHLCAAAPAGEVG
jgi:PAS domain S-box-containing protein